VEAGPGLADPAGVSFQSVNFPTMYLRQSSFALVLATEERRVLCSRVSIAKAKC